jgi:hypothetical protein
MAFTPAPAARDAIAALGFRLFPVSADEMAGEERARQERAATLPGSEAAAWIAPAFFAGSWAARRLPDLLAVCARWQPALIVREDIEFAGCVAAE